MEDNELDLDQILEQQLKDSNKPKAESNVKDENEEENLPPSTGAGRSSRIKKDIRFMIDLDEFKKYVAAHNTISAGNIDEHKIFDRCVKPYKSTVNGGRDEYLLNAIFSVLNKHPEFIKKITVEEVK